MCLVELFDSNFCFSTWISQAITLFCIAGYAHLTAIRPTGLKFDATFYVTGNDQKTFKDAQQAVLFRLLRQLQDASLELAKPALLVTTTNGGAREAT